MKVKSAKELEYMSEEMQKAYVHKCTEYWNEKKYDKADPDKLSAEEQEEYGDLLELFRLARIYELY